MRKIIFIGTLHGGITSLKELEELLRYYKPGQILVEIAEDDISQNKIGSYPPEMQFTLNFAIQQKIPVSGFDCTLDVFASGITKKENQAVIAQSKKIIGNKSWKEFNREKMLQLLYTPEHYSLIDFNKAKRRQRQMVDNLNRAMFKKGVIVVVTGCGNLSCFEEHFPQAEFPLRE